METHTTAASTNVLVDQSETEPSAEHNGDENNNGHTDTILQKRRRPLTEFEMASSPRQQQQQQQQQQPQQHNNKRAAVRRRGIVACEECRARKRKCDGGMPACGGCAKRMSECVYSYPSDDLGRMWQSRGVITSLQARLEQLEKTQSAAAAAAAVEQLTATTILSRPSSPNRVLPPLSNTTTTTNAADNANDTEAEVNWSDISSRASVRPNFNLNHNHSHHLHPKLVPQADVHFIRDQGHYSATHQQQTSVNHHPAQVEPAAPELPAQRRRRMTMDQLMKPVQQALDEIAVTNPKSATDDHLGLTTSMSPEVYAKTSSSGRHHCDFSTDILLNLPPRSHADSLVNRYFSSHHRLYPILHRQTFMKNYNRLWQPGEQTSPPSQREDDCPHCCRHNRYGKIFPMMLQAVFALASLLESSDAKSNQVIAEVFFARTQKSSLFEILDQDVGIDLIQVGLLMAYYLQSTDRWSKCWNIAGLTIRMAQNMGLQLSVSNARRKGFLGKELTQAEYEMRLRVWHACVNLDREISMCFGRPVMISTSETMIELPAAIDDDRLGTEIGIWNQQPKEEPTLLESFIYSIKLSEILGKILVWDGSSLTSPGRSGTTTPTGTMTITQSLLSLDSLITEWQRLLPKNLQYNRSLEEQEETALDMSPNSLVGNYGQPDQSSRLHARFLHARMLLHRPALFLAYHRAEREDITSDSIESKLHGLILSSVASHCISSAQHLIELLDTNLKFGRFPAWWYNVSHLYSAGTIILIARFCKLPGSEISSGSLLDSWTKCLRGLSRYLEVSSIARKSYHLLQTAAKDLAMDTDHQRTYDGEPNPNLHLEQFSVGQPNSYFPRNSHSTNILPNTETTLENLQSEDIPVNLPFILQGQTAGDNGVFGEVNYHLDNFPVLNGLRLAEMPFFTDLGTLPLGFENNFE